MNPTSNLNEPERVFKAFTKGFEWEDYVKEMAILESITKEEVMEVAQKYYQEFIFEFLKILDSKVIVTCVLSS